MKTIATLLLAVGAGVALMSASVSPAAAFQEKKEGSLVAQASFNQPAQLGQSESAGAAVRIITPEHNLETAIRSSEQGDILLLGPEGWYRLERKTLSQGTMIYVLGEQGSAISAFPKESGNSAVR